VKGTLAYMAPEVLRMVDAFREETSMDSTNVDNKAVDMWALGEIIYRILTGKPTFTSPLMLLRHADSASPLSLEHLKSLRVTDDACHFVENLMQGRPEKRLTAQEALRENWMRVYESTVSELLGQNSLRYAKAPIRHATTNA
jgi:serine/threonine protein kinase